MYAGQKMVDDLGVEVLLFPMDCMYITQGEHGSISHVLAMDFVGWSPQTGQIKDYPYYAPCSCTCIAKNYSNGQAYVIWQSTGLVHMANNQINSVCWVVMHDDNPPYNVGDTISQGDLMGHTGESGFVTGDHMHLNVANGTYQGWQNVGGSFYELINSMSIYDAMWVNDTTLYNDYGYDWKVFEGGITPVPPTPEAKKKKRFPWVLYANKLRNQRKI